MNRLSVAAVMLAAVSVSASAMPAAAQSAAEKFFAGKTVTMIVGYPPGGGFDLAARMVTQHIGRFIPGNPTVITQNMPGASSIKAANYVYNVAAKDGSVIYANDSTHPMSQRLKKTGKFEPHKFYWLGRLTADDSVGLSWHTSGVKTVGDAMKKEIVMAAGGKSGPAAMIPSALNNLVGTKFKVVLGYKGSAPMVAAMEKGEAGGTATYGYTALKTLKPHWLKNNQVNVLFVIGFKRNPEIPHVPTLPELGNTDLDKKVLSLLTSRSAIGRSYVAPPGIAADRGAVLRKAFDAMINDAGFRADMAKRKFPVDPATGEEILKVVEDVMTASNEVAERALWAVTRR
jgi:tripartite-type tricarboxylate transporter receptor subunit TctC